MLTAAYLSQTCCSYALQQRASVHDFNVAVFLEYKSEILCLVSQMSASKRAHLSHSLPLIWNAARLRFPADIGRPLNFIRKISGGEKKPCISEFTYQPLRKNTIGAAKLLITTDISGGYKIVTSIGLAVPIVYFSIRELVYWLSKLIIERWVYTSTRICIN